MLVAMVVVGQLMDVAVVVEWKLMVVVVEGQLMVVVVIQVWIQLILADLV